MGLFFLGVIVGILATLLGKVGIEKLREKISGA